MTARGCWLTACPWWSTTAYGVVTKNGTATLDAGVNLIRIEYFEKGGGEHLSLDMSGPGIKKLQLAHNTARRGCNKPAIATRQPDCAREQ